MLVQGSDRFAMRSPPRHRWRHATEARRNAATASRALQRSQPMLSATSSAPLVRPLSLDLYGSSLQNKCGA
eukprot:14355660-Alexandrium_andersonii.AAC.1